MNNLNVIFGFGMLVVVLWGAMQRSTAEFHKAELVKFEAVYHTAKALEIQASKCKDHEVAVVSMNPDTYAIEKAPFCSAKSIHKVEAR